MSTPAVVPMFDPQGNVRNIPAAQIDAATQAGGKKAIAMLDPQGTQRYVPEDQVNNALGAGGKLVNPPQQPQSFWQRIGLLPSSNMPPPSNEPGGPTISGSQPADILGQALGQGMKEVGKSYLQLGPQTAGKGAKEIAQGQFAKGGHDLFSGASTSLMPVMPELVARNPMMAIRALAGGFAGSQVAGIGAQALGANPDQQALASDVGNLAGGFTAASGLTRALLETPTKQLVRAYGPQLLNLMEPRKFAMKWIAEQLAQGGKAPVTDAPTQAVLDSAVQRLNEPTPQAGSQPAPSQPQAPTQVQAQPSAQPSTAPAPESPPAASPVDPKQFYGKTSGRSNLKANQRQLASPTGSTAPGPAAAQGPHPANIMRILQTPGDISDADMQTVQNYFAQQKLLNMLRGNIQGTQNVSFGEMLKKAAGQ